MKLSLTADADAVLEAIHVLRVGKMLLSFITCKQTLMLLIKWINSGNGRNQNEKEN